MEEDRRRGEMEERKGERLGERRRAKARSGGERRSNDSEEQGREENRGGEVAAIERREERGAESERSRGKQERYKGNTSVRKCTVTSLSFTQNSGLTGPRNHRNQN